MWCLCLCLFSVRVCVVRVCMCVCVFVFVREAETERTLVCLCACLSGGVILLWKRTVLGVCIKHCVVVRAGRWDRKIVNLR